MSKLKPTDTTQFFTDLTGGVFADQIGVALSDVAESVVGTGKKGQVTLTFDLSQMGDKESNQIEVKHKLASTAPERFGSRKEDYTRKTTMFVNDGGRVSLKAFDMGDLFENTNKETDA